MSNFQGQFRYMFVAGDYSTSIAFYRDGLGLPIDHDWNFGPEDCGTVFLAGHGMIEVIGGLPGVQFSRPQGGWLSIQVDDVDALHKLLVKRGLMISEPPTSYPWGQRIIKLADPDGLVLWFFSPIETE